MVGLALRAAAKQRSGRGFLSVPSHPSPLLFFLPLSLSLSHTHVLCAELGFCCNLIRHFQVQRSREKAKAKKAVHRQFQRDKERKAAQLAMEAEMLRKNVDVLLKAVSHPSTLTAIEQAWVQTLSHSNTGTVLASQCALYS